MQARSSGGPETVLWVPTTAVSVTQTQSGLIFLNSFCGPSPPQGCLLYVESVLAPDSTKGRSDAFTPTRRGWRLWGKGPLCFRVFGFREVVITNEKGDEEWAHRLKCNIPVCAHSVCRAYKGRRPST